MTNNEWNREPPQYKYGDDPSKPPPQEGFATCSDPECHYHVYGAPTACTGNQWDLTEPAAMLRNASIRPRQGITAWGVIKWILVFGVALFLILTIVSMVLGFIAGMESSL